MNFELNTKCSIDFEDGMAIDYVDDRFVVLVKDDVWTEYEIKALRKNKLTVSFYEQDHVCLFLINVDDALETSDCPFNICSDDYSDLLNHQGNYALTMVYLDKDNTIVAKKEVTFDNAFSALIKNKLTECKLADISEEQFEANYTAIAKAKEPFELEEIALGNNTFKK